MAFSVICFQENWLKDDDDDISPYLLPGYNLIIKRLYVANMD